MLTREANTQGLGYRAAIDRLMELLLIQMLRRLGEAAIPTQGVLAGLVDLKTRRALDAMQVFGAPGSVTSGQQGRPGHAAALHPKKQAGTVRRHQRRRWQALTARDATGQAVAAAALVRTR